MGNHGGVPLEEGSSCSHFQRTGSEFSFSKVLASELNSYLIFTVTENMLLLDKMKIANLLYICEGDGILKKSITDIRT